MLHRAKEERSILETMKICYIEPRRRGVS